jgi:hypothetical protein
MDVANDVVWLSVVLYIPSFISLPFHVFQGVGVARSRGLGYTAPGRFKVISGFDVDRDIPGFDCITVVAV